MDSPVEIEMRHSGMRVLGGDDGVIEKSGGDESGDAGRVDVGVEKQNLAEDHFQADAQPKRVEAQQQADDTLLGA